MFLLGRLIYPEFLSWIWSHLCFSFRDILRLLKRLIRRLNLPHPFWSDYEVVHPRSSSTRIMYIERRVTSRFKSWRALIDIISILSLKQFGGGCFAKVFCKRILEVLIRRNLLFGHDVWIMFDTSLAVLGFGLILDLHILIGVIKRVQALSFFVRKAVEGEVGTALVGFYASWSDGGGLDSLFLAISRIKIAHTVRWLV